MINRHFSEQEMFIQRTNLDRVALAIQFLEKTNPSDDARFHVENFIVQMLLKQTDLEKERNEYMD